MTVWEYMTHVVLFQPGEPAQDEHGQFKSGMTTAFLNEMGKQGWELLSTFPWQVQTAQVALAANGREAPNLMPALFCVFKRSLGSNLVGGTGEQTASVGYPRY